PIIVPGRHMVGERRRPKSMRSSNTWHQPAFLRGNPLRFVFAKSANCCSLIEFTIWRDAPWRLAFDRSPRLAASAAPAAICCFFDLAGILCSILADWTLPLARNQKVADEGPP